MSSSSSGTTYSQTSRPHQDLFTPFSLSTPSSTCTLSETRSACSLSSANWQLTKEQLVSVLPLLVQHLNSPNSVIYSYAAITIERILFIKGDNRQPLSVFACFPANISFTSADVRPFAENILMALFTNIEKGGTPEKIAENDYLMKCAMRVIITARQELVSSHQAILNHLVNIMGEISKNPSNPRFNQYCFESVSALIRFVCEASPETLPFFERSLFGPAEVILSQDVAGASTLESRADLQSSSPTSSRSLLSFSSSTLPLTCPPSTRHCLAHFSVHSSGNNVETSPLSSVCGKHFSCAALRFWSPMARSRVCLAFSSV